MSIDFGAIKQAAADSAATASSRPRFAPLPANTFPAASLSAWMEWAQRAQVPAVPTQVVATLPIEALLRSDDPTFEGSAQAMEELMEVNETLTDSHMLRWDCCAGFEVKMGMAEGQVPDLEGRKLHPMEPRTFDILYEFPCDEVAVLRRPWVEVDSHEGFPVEFRVFVERGQVVAVANYYLQRDLPDTPAIRQAAAKVVRHAQAMIDVMASSGVAPAMPGQPLPHEIAATLDFLVDKSGQVLFLEAGPGHHFGAHPCAFLKRDGSVAELEGLCLGTGRPSIPLTSL